MPLCCCFITLRRCCCTDLGFSLFTKVDQSLYCRINQFSLVLKGLTEADVLKPTEHDNTEREQHVMVGMLLRVSSVKTNQSSAVKSLKSPSPGKRSGSLVMEGVRKRKRRRGWRSRRRKGFRKSLQTSSQPPPPGQNVSPGSSGDIQECELLVLHLSFCPSRAFVLSPFVRLRLSLQVTGGLGLRGTGTQT